SPSTTLGNISSWVAQDLKISGPDISHSITCSSGLNAILNAIAWLQSGLCTHFLAGAAEAPLTPFTIAQMEALRIYSKIESEFPCQALNWNKKQNTLVLGEAAGMVALENKINPNRIATITGIGYATEIINHPIALSTNAECLQKSMRMALQNANRDWVDVVILHAPGTIKGDMAELEAIRAVFGKNLPALTGNKWKIGHTFGTSGIMSLELAVLMLQKQFFIGVPWIQQESPKQINSIMINAVGFGGNAVSIIVEK
ncbi:MAG: beta-ketoacyl synthase, partial [Bacteroidia bacterium]|nr:beta-ketoacyl synthase [Bacteroidia bacterium]